ncbi:hypothetical protein AVEN_146943-1 [Araneus ventricosus]|uniref:Uncharacterized protein n=1 Tax=Araneus ventricosus TaxID=182803 RepID=A0A4Y2M2S9_ARAVE|nr:hypothetical protein AVEN_146943-1 [Araneus ventricosus]
MFGERITWFRHVKRDSKLAAGSKVQRVAHFPTGTTICVITIESFKEAGKESMASGEFNNLLDLGRWDAGDFWHDIKDKSFCFAFIPVCHL